MPFEIIWTGIFGVETLGIVVMAIGFFRAGIELDIGVFIGEYCVKIFLNGGGTASMFIESDIIGIGWTEVFFVWIGELRLFRLSSFFVVIIFLLSITTLGFSFRLQQTDSSIWHSRCIRKRFTESVIVNVNLKLK